MTATAEELLQGLNASRVSIVTFERGQNLWKYTAPRIRAKLPRLLPDAPIFNRLRESQGIFNTDDVRTEPDLTSVLEMLGENARALLILPLASGGILNALVFVQLVGENRFGINELESGAHHHQSGEYRVGECPPLSIICSHVRPFRCA